MQVAAIRKRLENIKGHKAAIISQKKAEESRLTALLRQHDTNTQAHLILQEAAKMTQENLQYRISTLVSLAMEAVFEDPYHILLTFEPARGKTVGVLEFEKDGNTVNPLDASGGGAVDVASLGMLFSLWTLQTPRTRPMLILDEPLKWLKGGELPAKGAAMLSQLSHKLGIQIIMVSHSPELIDHADKVFQVMKKRGISSVKVLK